MKKVVTALFLAGSVLVFGGCAATEVPVVGSMTPAPTAEAEAERPLTVTPTESPIPIIVATPEAEAATPVPVSLTPIVEAEDHLKMIGEKAEGESVFRIRLTNNTGESIVSFRVISDLAAYYGDESNYGNLLSEGDVFLDREERILYYDTYRDPSNDAEEKNYNLRLTYADGSEYEIAMVPFADMEEGSIRAARRAPYLSYHSLASGKEASTAEGVLLYEGEAASDESGEDLSEENADSWEENWDGENPEESWSEESWE